MQESSQAKVNFEPKFWAQAFKPGPKLIPALMKAEEEEWEELGVTFDDCRFEFRRGKLVRVVVDGRVRLWRRDAFVAVVAVDADVDDRTSEQKQAAADFASLGSEIRFRCLFDV